MTPLKAIRAKCLDCSGGSAKEVRECPAKDCPLYEYRSGKTKYKRPDVSARMKKVWEEKRQAM